MKTAYKIFLAIIIIFTIIYVAHMGRKLINTDLTGNTAVVETHRLVYSRWFSYVQCGDQTLKSFGYPTTGLPCTSEAYCQDNWPSGVSYQVRDTKAVCCTEFSSIAFGECGQWSTVEVKS
jgi:hypothetical protein